MPSYDPNNIFAKILRGELPAHKVYEDDKAIAFLDIMPQATGHTLVVPKSPARTILDIAPDDLAHAIKVAQKIAKAAVPLRPHGSFKEEQRVLADQAAKLAAALEGA